MCRWRSHDAGNFYSAFGSLLCPSGFWMTQMNSLTQAVANVLNLFSPNGSDFNVYSYLDDFDYLWGLGAHVNSGLLQSCSAGMAEGNQLVIWDGTPQHRDASGGANIQDHVTVFDWLVAMSLRAAESPAAPQYRVFVLDLASSRHSCSFSCQVFPMLLPRMPWVRVIRPAGADEEKPVPVPGNASDNLVEATRLGAVLPQPDVLGVDRLIELHRMADVPTIGDDTTLLKCTATLLRQLWKSELTKAETRHSVSNLVAPFVLVDGLCEEGWLGASRLQQKLAESRSARHLECCCANWAYCRKSGSQKMRRHDCRSSKTPISFRRVITMCSGGSSRFGFCLSMINTGLGMKTSLPACCSGPPMNRGNLASC